MAPKVEQSQVSSEALALGYQPEAVPIRALVRFLLGLVVFGIALHALLWKMMDHMESVNAQMDTPRSVLEAWKIRPPVPNLQPSTGHDRLPRQDLEELRNREDLMFMKLGWKVDASRHEAGIPPEIVRRVAEDERIRKSGPVVPPTTTGIETNSISPRSMQSDLRPAPNGGAAMISNFGTGDRGLLAVFAISMVFASMADSQVPAPILAGPTGTPRILRDVGIDPHEGDAIPADLVFQDESGRVVKLIDFFGERPVILALVYYRCPMLCTMVLNDLTRSMNSLPTTAGKEFEVVVVSFDPNETPELAAAKKEQYLRAYRRAGSDQGWHFLTGSQASISRLTAAVGFRYAWDAKNQQWAHASGLVILTPQGRIARYFFGIDYAPNDLRLALAEAGAQKISPSPTTRILEYCFHYDPSTGRYGLMVMRLLQTAGVLVLALIGGSIWLTLRRDKKALARSLT